MRTTKKLFLLLLAVSAVLLATILPPVIASPAPAAGYELEMSLEARGDGIYDCRVSVAKNGEVLAAPRVQVAAGSEGRARSSSPRTGDVVDLVVDTDAQTLAYTVEIRNAQGDALARHTARVQM